MYTYSYEEAKKTNSTLVILFILFMFFVFGWFSHQFSEVINNMGSLQIGFTLPTVKSTSSDALILPIPKEEFQKVPQHSSSKNLGSTPEKSI